MTVVETGRFLKDAERLLPEPDRARLGEFIGANPEAGHLIQRPAASGSCGGLCRVPVKEAVRE